MANAQDSAALHKDPWYNEVNLDEVRALIKSAVEKVKSECDTIVEVTDLWQTSRPIQYMRRKWLLT